MRVSANAPVWAGMGCVMMAMAAMLGAMPADARAATIAATPENYREKLRGLQPGDTLQLAPGNYESGLPVANLTGTERAFITIKGPANGPAAVILGDPHRGRNTVEITQSCFVAIENLTIDGQRISGIHAISAKGGHTNRVHHITIAGCKIINHGGEGGAAGQQTVGISTKTPTWGWIIRGNTITGAGTGLYLGNSNGDEAFIGGIIEGNLVDDPIGYCMEIKHQNPRPDGAVMPGIPSGDSVTIIRHNVFIKNDSPSPSGNRPNVLLGHFPRTGAGSTDRYEIYGNFFFNNPHENLLQAEGRVAIHDNVFVAAGAAAIRLGDHNGTLDVAHVYANTIFACTRGIYFANAARVDHAVIGNVVFGEQPIGGEITTADDNITGPEAAARGFFVNPSTTLGEMDFYPKRGKGRGNALDLRRFAADHADFDRDFNGDDKGRLQYRGAYAGDRRNPGFALDRALKPLPTARR